VEVRRVVVDVRVVDPKGLPIEGLTTANFRVFVDGDAAPLEGVEWVSGTTPYAEGPSPEQAAAAGTAPAPKGRLVVMLFQADFAHERLTGQMRLKSRAIKVLAGLNSADRVAIVSFDSHLKLRVDFTDDRDTLTRAIHEAILFGEPKRLPPSPEPSLAAHWNWQAARDAAEPEAGLLVLAQALQELPGNKSLIYFGWGLGSRGGGFVWMDHSYPAARATLVKARVSVYAIDVTDADYHDLEVGLIRVAADTGGFYMKTNIFPDQAVTRLEGAIAGHYVLVFECPQKVHGEHYLAVELLGAGKGRVLASNSFQD
jgi:VWFA-related protein